MDKVFCPYCGKCMNPKINKLGLRAYECMNCFSISPVATTIDDAVAMAQTRVKPLQKPLTLEEARKNPTVIYFEHKSLSKFNGYGVRIMCESRYRMQDGSIMPMLSKHVTNNSLYIGEFGIDWRCWATKPTDEEREAAKWDK